MTLELIMAFVPSVLVLITAYLVIRTTLKNEQVKRMLDNKFIIQKEVIILRLQAYERLVLFLERISPHNLVLRLDKDGLTAHEFHLQLLATIRAEFEHNLAQQLYVSDIAWQSLLNTKEEVIKMINISKEHNEENTAYGLSRAIISNLMGKEPITNDAIALIKQEASSLF